MRLSRSFDLSKFSSLVDTIQMFATTTSPGGSVPDWKQHREILKLTGRPQQRFIQMNLYPKSVYTLVMQGVLR